MTQDVDLIFTLYRLGRHFKSISKVHNHDHLLGLYILKTLENQDLTNSELAELSAMKASAMSEKLEGLVKEGLVDRQKAKDARKLILKITPKGKVHLLELISCIKQHSQKYLHKLSNNEIDQLVILLNKIEI